MLDISPTEKHLVVIAISGVEVGLYRRSPTTKERLDYQVATIQTKKNKFGFDNAARLKFGLALVTGIRDGDLGFEGQPLSSDPQSPHFRADWKAILRDHRADLLMGVAMDAFEAARIDQSAGDEDEPPFSTS